MELLSSIQIGQHHYSFSIFILGSVMEPDLPTIDDIRAAHQRIQDGIHETPLLSCAALQGLVPHHQQLLFKCENFQKTGSFKIRGATNAVRLSLQRNPTRRKFLTHSSGNHAQALALACKSANAEAHIVIPSNAPAVKAAAVKGYGATLHPCVPTLAARQEKAIEVEKSHGPFTFVHPFDNHDVIAGQGTMMIEVQRQLTELGANPPDAIVVPVGGGGLISGVSIAAKALFPNVKVFGAEPKMADDAERSYRSREVLPHRTGCPDTIADGLLTTLANRTFRAIQKHVDDIFTATEDEVRSAFRVVYERMKIVIEPSAAVGVAVLMNAPPELRKCKNVVVVVCGGNVQLDSFGNYLNPMPPSKL